MKEINLNISERRAALEILNAFKGDLTTLSVLIEDVKPFIITDEDWTNANLVKTPILRRDAQGAVVLNPDGSPVVESESWNWDNEKGGLKAISIRPETGTYLETKIKEKDAAKEITVADLPLVTLLEKIK